MKFSIFNYSLIANDEIQLKNEKSNRRIRKINQRYFRHVN